MTSLTIENYVKTIYELCARGTKPLVAPGQVAAALHVSPGTVTSMLKTLSETGLASYVPYEGVALTPTGRTLALRVLRRHRLIEQFLAHTLDLTWDEVHDEAENMEHAVSDLLVDRIEAYLGYPTTDPHGDPIPTSDGQVHEANCQPMTELSPGASFRLVRVLDQAPIFLQRLTEQGLDLGAEGEYVGSSTSDTIVSVKFGLRTVDLPRTDAVKLLVESSNNHG